jgi:hypothetical protein
MAQALVKQILSGSTNGRPIPLTGTNSAGADTIHTAQSGSGQDFDEVWLWLVNTSASEVKVTIEWGGTTDPDDHIVIKVPAESTVQGPALVIENSLVVKAFAGAADVVNVAGYIIRSNEVGA